MANTQNYINHLLQNTGITRRAVKKSAWLPRISLRFSATTALTPRCRNLMLPRPAGWRLPLPVFWRLPAPC